MIITSSVRHGLMKNEMQLKFIILVIIVSTVHLYYYSPSCVFLLLHQNTSTGIFVNFEAPKFTMRVVLALWVDRASVFSFCDHSQCIGLMLMSIDSGNLRDISVDGNIILTLMLTKRYMRMWTGRQ